MPDEQRTRQRLLTVHGRIRTVSDIDWHMARRMSRVSRDPVQRGIDMFKGNARALVSSRSRDALLRRSFSLVQRNHSSVGAGGASTPFLSQCLKSARVLGRMRNLFLLREKGAVVKPRPHRADDDSVDECERLRQEVLSRLPGRITTLDMSRAADGSYVLAGVCQCYYVKQCIQHLVMELMGNGRIVNRIRVLPPR